MEINLFSKAGLFLFEVLRLLMRLKSWLCGTKDWDEGYKLFQLPLTPEIFNDCLIPRCYQYNHLGYVYRDQLFQMRRLTDRRHQIHLRLYKEGWITGHYELQPEVDPRGHLRGDELRHLSEEEINEIIEALPKRKLK